MESSLGARPFGRPPVGGQVESGVELGRVLAERATLLAVTGRTEEADRLQARHSGLLVSLPRLAALAERVARGSAARADPDAALEQPLRAVLGDQRCGGA